MAPTPWIPHKYPIARRSDHVDVYQSAASGQARVADPYQWMEEYSDEVEKWISEQESFTRSYLDKNADRQKLEDAFRASMNYAKVTSSHTPSLYHPSCSSSLVFGPLLERRWSLVLVLQ